MTKTITPTIHQLHRVLEAMLKSQIKPSYGICFSRIALTGNSFPARACYSSIRAEQNGEPNGPTRALGVIDYVDSGQLIVPWKEYGVLM